MKKYKAFLFDFDGTILDTYELIMNAWDAAVNCMGITAAKEDLLRNFGRTLEEAVGVLANQYQVKEYSVDAIHDAYWHYHNSHHNEITGVFPGVEETLKSLKEKGALIGIVTSGMYSSCFSEAKEFGIEKYFDIIVGAEVAEPKPSPQPALISCEKLGVLPSETLMIGDSRHDLACGKKAGCDTALVSWTLSNVNTFVGPEIPDILIKDASDLLQFI